MHLNVLNYWAFSKNESMFVSQFKDLSLTDRLTHCCLGSSHGFNNKKNTEYHQHYLLICSGSDLWLHHAPPSPSSFGYCNFSPDLTENLYKMYLEFICVLRKNAKLSGSSFSNVSICCVSVFYDSKLFSSLGFEPLVGQNKTFKDVILDILNPLLTFYRLRTITWLIKKAICRLFHTENNLWYLSVVICTCLYKNKCHVFPKYL